jgi:hypothetical protein
MYTTDLSLYCPLMNDIIPIEIVPDACAVNLTECSTHLYMAEDVELPALHDKWCRVQVAEGHPAKLRGEKDFTFFTQPDPLRFINWKIGVVQGIANFENGEAFVKIANFGDRPQYLDKGVRVGFATPYEASPEIEMLAIEVNSDG